MHNSKESWWRRRSPLERRLVQGAFVSLGVCFVLIIYLAFLSGAAYRSHQLRESSQICYTPGCIHIASRLLKDMDLTVDPCDDFYKFSCGEFIKKKIIPDDKSYLSTASPMDDRLMQQLRMLMEAPPKDGDPNAFRLVKKMYASCMNRTAIEQNKLKPLLEIIKRVGGWPVVDGHTWSEEDFSWREMSYRLREEGFKGSWVLGFNIITDLKNSTRRVIQLDQASLGCDRAHLIKGLNSKIVREYNQYQVDLAVIFGAVRARAQDEMADVLEFEIKLANISLSDEIRRDNARLFNPMTISVLQQKYPFIPWLDHFRRIFPPSITLTQEEPVIVFTPDYISKLEDILNTTPKRVLANYLMWRAVFSVTDYLHAEVLNRQLRYENTLYGVKERRSRWKDCVTNVNYNLLETAVGAMYARKYFDDHSRRQARRIVAGIRHEMVKIITTLDWMDARTRNFALEKLHHINEQIGYPDELMDDKELDKFHSGLELDSTRYLENSLNLTKFTNNWLYDRFRKPINKTEWLNYASVAIINAFYNQHQNSIAIPAGILQGIFFSKLGPRYMNYGSIGYVIGHEITHGFDDVGSQYDGQGNLRNWWATETRKMYLEKARCIIEQYGNYTVAEVNMKLNGVNNQGENIADNGGMKQAYRAYTSWVKRHGPEPRLPGLSLSPKQLFWVSAAYTWCSKIRPEYLRSWIPTGQHSPNEFRVVGPVSNLKDFARDFNCPIGSKMNPPKKCQVW